MRKCVVISSRAADAVIVSTEIRRDHTRRRRPPSTQTLLLGRLLGLVGVYGGRRPTRRRDGRACTCSLLRPSALLRMLVAWGRASQTPESTHNAYTRGARWGGVEPLQSCVSASGSAADARFFFFFFFFFSEPSSDLARFFDGFVSAGGGGGREPRHFLRDDFVPAITRRFRRLSRSQRGVASASRYCREHVC